MAVVRKQKSGKRMRYMLDYRYQGRRVRKTIRTDDALIAKKVLKKVEAEIVLNTHKLVEEKERNISLGDLLKEYLQEREGIELAPKTSIMHRKTLQRFSRHFGGGMTMREIGRTMVEDYRSTMLKQFCLSATTVNIEMRVLRTVWNWALQDHKKYVEKNVFNKLRPIPVDEKVRHFMHDEEVARLFKVLRDPLLRGKTKTCALAADRFVTFLLMVGSRRTETVELRWKHIDFAHGIIRFEKTKTDRTRYIPMNAEVRRLLEGMMAEKLNSGPEDRVFGYTDPEASGRAFRRFARIAGLPSEITLHSTRHTAATNALRKGADIMAVKEYLGHSCLSTTMIYAKVVGSMLGKVSTTLSVEDTIKSGSEVESDSHP